MSTTHDLPTRQVVLERIHAVERAHGFDVEQRQEVADELEALARAAGDEGAALRASLLRVEPLCAVGAFAHAVALASAAQAHAELLGDDELLACAHHSFALLSIHAGDPAEATWHAVRSVELLPDGSPAWLRALHLVCLSYCTLERPGSLAAVISEVLEIAVAEGDTALQLSALNNTAWNAHCEGRVEDALREARRMRELSRRAGLPLRRADLDTIASVELAAGRLDDAWATVSWALDPGSPDGGPLVDVDVRLTAWAVLTALGRTDDAFAQLQAARATASRRGHHAALARIEEAQSSHLAAAGDWRGAYEAQVRLQQERTRTRLEQNTARTELAVARYDAETTRRERDRYRALAYTDALTGLPNRRAVEEHAAKLLEGAEPLAVAVLDVDHFKSINDEWSHDTGDAVLRELGALLRDNAAAAPGTVVARLGGEEFVVVWSSWAPPAVGLWAEALRAAVARHDWAVCAPGLAVTVSIGCATGGTGRTWPELLAAADARLYEAKRGGRDRVVVADA